VNIRSDRASDGQVVWHSPLFAWRVRQVAEAVHAGQTVSEPTQ
jgi:hypothetical protein